MDISSSANIHKETFLSDDIVIEEGVTVGAKVVFAGSGISVRKFAKIDAASVIGESVTIGQGAWVKCGAVVLKSVPPNAIVEGNPAQVVGYSTSELSWKSSKSTPKYVDYNTFSSNPLPARYQLDVGDSAVYLMRKYSDSRGSLTVGEVPSDLPFEPVRYFVVYDVPSSELRGEHAHLQCHQFLMCLHGSCHVLLDDGVNRCEVLLDRPDMGVYMPAMVWGTQYKYSKDASLLVFASKTYEAQDYIRTYDEFLIQLDIGRTA